MAGCNVLRFLQSSVLACFSLAADGRRNIRKRISRLRRRSSSGSSPGQPDVGAKVALFGQPLSDICGEDGTLPQPVQDLLATLYLEGPSTEGIFRIADSEKARKELKEDLNKGRNVDLKTQSVHLLAVILKDFLRNIPSKLLSTKLYEKWMNALEKPSKEEQIEELKEVADQLPRANLVLLRHLLSMLHHISQNAETNRMNSRNLAICIGPNMLSPEMDNALPLEALKEMNDKVTVLVEFLINNCSEIFGEDTAFPVCASTEESPEHTDSSTEHFCAAQQNDSAYDSPGPEAGGSLCTSQEEQPKERSTNDIITTDRRFSGPGLSFQHRLKCRIRNQKQNRSEDNFPGRQKQIGLEALEKEPARLPPQLSTDSLAITSSSCTLESSDSVVFISSPPVLPSSPPKSFSIRSQSFSIKATGDCSPPSKEKKRHPLSFSFANCRKRLLKIQSWGPGKNMAFLRDSFTKQEDQFSCRVAQNDPGDAKPLPVAYQRRPSFRTDDDVFGEVEQQIQYVKETSV